jgi:hypothetical protein
VERAVREWCKCKTPNFCRDRTFKVAPHQENLITVIGNCAETKYRVIRNDCRGLNNLSYTIQLK